MQLYTILKGIAYAVCVNLAVLLYAATVCVWSRDGVLMLCGALVILIMASPIYFFIKNHAQPEWIYRWAVITGEIVCFALLYFLGDLLVSSWDSNSLEFVLIQIALPIVFLSLLFLDLITFVITLFKNKKTKVE